MQARAGRAVGGAGVPPPASPEWGPGGEQSPADRASGGRGSQAHSPRGSETRACAPPPRVPRCLVRPQRELCPQPELGRGRGPASSAWGRGRGRSGRGRGSRRKWGGGTRGGAPSRGTGILRPVPVRESSPWGHCAPTCAHTSGHPETLPFGSPMPGGAPSPASPPCPGADRGHGNG